jgi:hypothetical protein
MNAHRWTHQAFLREDVLVQPLGQESVLLNLDSEQYFGLDDVGTAMLQCLQESPSIQAALEALLMKYDVESGQLQHDLLELIQKLEAHGLVQVTAP